jgi:hypothetical protein
LPPRSSGGRKRRKRKWEVRATFGPQRGGATWEAERTSGAAENDARNTEPAVTTVVDGVVLVGAMGVTVVNWFRAVVIVPSTGTPALETAHVAPVATALMVLYACTRPP